MLTISAVQKYTPRDDSVGGKLNKIMFFAHYSQVPDDLWHWPNFTPTEVASRGNGSLLIDSQAMDRLQAARELANRPLTINSAFRDEMYNAMIGGSPRSYHLEGKAFDISLQNFEKAELISILRTAGFTGLGVNYTNFVHADTGRNRTW